MDCLFGDAPSFEVIADIHDNVRKVRARHALLVQHLHDQLVHFEAVNSAKRGAVNDLRAWSAFRDTGEVVRNFEKHCGQWLQDAFFCCADPALKIGTRNSRHAPVEPMVCNLADHDWLLPGLL